MAKKSDRIISKNWERVKQRLRAELGEEVYSSWFGRVELVSVNSGLIQLSVPTKFLQKWLQSHYATNVLETCKNEMADVASLEFMLRGPNTMMNANNELANSMSDASSAATAHRAPGRMAGSAPVTNNPVRPTNFRPTRQKNDGSPLNPRQTFSSFVVSASNRLAFAAAKQIAENLAAYHPKYNPLFFSCRCWSWQNPSVAGDCLGTEAKFTRNKGHLSDSRALHG